MSTDETRTAFKRWEKDPANKHWNHMTFPAYKGGHDDATASAILPVIVAPVSSIT
jgi:hypothetical protein